jgi:hypothetical protein
MRTKLSFVVEVAMKPDEFRAIALTMPDAVEGSHMKHPDFRAGNKVFATLGHPDENSGMVKLTREQQEMLVAAEPKIFAPATGAWGRRGSTIIDLQMIDKKTAASAIQMAWKNTAA